MVLFSKSNYSSQKYSIVPQHPCNIKYQILLCCLSKKKKSSSLFLLISCLHCMSITGREGTQFFSYSGSWVEWKKLPTQNPVSTKNILYQFLQSPGQRERGWVDFLESSPYSQWEPSEVPGAKVLPTMTVAQMSSIHSASNSSSEFPVNVTYRHQWSLEATVPGKQMPLLVSPSRHLLFQVLEQTVAPTNKFSDRSKK